MLVLNHLVLALSGELLPELPDVIQVQTDHQPIPVSLHVLVVRVAALNGVGALNRGGERLSAIGVDYTRGDVIGKLLDSDVINVFYP